MDVVCLGGAVVDFLPDGKGKRVREVRRWTPCPGGSAANVAVGVARLGGRSALLGCTGDDEFGHFLRAELAQEGVDVSHLRHTSQGATGLGFVSLTAQGDRSFIFYRRQAAETFFGARDVRAARELLRAAAVVHVNTNALVRHEARRAALGLLHQAARRGQLTSVDPNLRPHLWERPAELKALVDDLVSTAAVVKLSEEELRFVTGAGTVEAGLARLEARGALVAIVTLAGRGALVRKAGQLARVRAPRVKVVDTTGAGDGFTAGFLATLSRRLGSRSALAGASLAEVLPCVVEGCRVGSQVVTALGAIAGLPRERGQLRVPVAAALRRPASPPP